jgi:FAD:protein FMN transferase
MITVEKEVPNKIMSTDFYIALSSNEVSETDMETDISFVLKLLNEFEQKYSRFIKDNELMRLNNSEKFTASNELFEILQISHKFYIETKGLFDPAILNSLLNEGYNVSKIKGFYEQNIVTIKNSYNFNRVILDSTTFSVNKPKELHIDLGGIGKSYVVDKIATLLKNKYSDFCIDLGGDMYLAGSDKKNNYLNWAIEIENPINDPGNTTILPTLLLSDISVATSGVNKRKWDKSGSPKNHIINPITGKSVDNDLLTVTVISTNTITADIYAKVLLIMGKEQGIDFCKHNDISAIFIDNNLSILVTDTCQKYLWKESTTNS